MKVRQWITAIVLLLLVAVAIVGLVWTRALPAEDESSAVPAKKLLGRRTAAAHALTARPIPSPLL